MKTLLIGGTADGRHLAIELYALGFDLTYSIAGIARKAQLPCTVVTGGFTQFGGLANYVTAQNITHIVDVTHPFAQKMGNKACQVAQLLGLPYIRFHRQNWPKTLNDHWISVQSWPELITQVAGYQSLFITAGQVTQQQIDKLARQATHILLRTAMPVSIDLPANVTWVKAIGPFQLGHEKQLLSDYKVDVIISKNSGGESTYAKIQAAAELGLPVYQFERPALIAAQYQFDNAHDCIEQLIHFRDEHEV